MNRTYFVIILFIFYCTKIFATNIVLPLIIPSDTYGFDFKENKKNIKFKLKLIYTVDKTKIASNNENIAFLLPIPSSNDFQKITISEIKNFTLHDVKRDIFGNTVIETENININLIKELVLILYIVINPVEYLAPEDLSDDIIFNESVINYYKNNFKINLFANKNILMNDIKINNKTFDEIMLFINNFKMEVNTSRENIEKIYDEKTIELYPITNKSYYKKALELIYLLSMNGITSRIAESYYVPDGIDFFSRDFFIEIFIPGKGFLVLDKFLKQFNNNGYYIFNYYYSPDKNNFSSYEYFGYIENGKIFFLDNKIDVYIGEILANNNPDFRYFYIFDSKISYKMTESKLYNDFIVNDSSLKNDGKSFILFQKQKNKSLNSSKENPLNIYVKKIDFCSQIQNNKPLNVGKIFENKDTIYAFIDLDQTKINKTFTVKWITPNNETYLSNNVDVPGFWQYTYIYIKPDGEFLFEKGVWTLELYSDGKLDGKAFFEIK